MAAFKKPGRTTRDRKPAAKKAAAAARVAAAAQKAASGNTSTKKVARVKAAPKGATITVTQVRSEIGNSRRTVRRCVHSDCVASGTPTRCPIVPRSAA